ncbi:hypothetical protein DICVIV_10912 [Dictyocaulus viviparus]|uniref:Uncharacterized protein n=1 Tax=Dictyocaulus viviparus TaxID=29172 RepID=A0A0D8XL58_DICVI|nr:hypothetical protein DICVIV_10912 [Dictyocaulus viviparus]
MSADGSTPSLPPQAADSDVDVSLSLKSDITILDTSLDGGGSGGIDRDDSGGFSFAVISENPIVSDIGVTSRTPIGDDVKKSCSICNYMDRVHPIIAPKNSLTKRRNFSPFSLLSENVKNTVAKMSARKTFLYSVIYHNKTELPRVSTVSQDFAILFMFTTYHAFVAVQLALSEKKQETVRKQYNTTDFRTVDLTTKQIRLEIENVTNDDKKKTDRIRITLTTIISAINPITDT